jgi:putative FmdB family regulatory protein
MHKERGAVPIYEYACKNCDVKFEKLVRAMSSAAEETAKVKCPACGSSKTARALSVFAVSSDGGKSSASADVPMCGRCGGPPGSCAME